MAYTEKLPSMVPVGAGAADDLSATGVHTYSEVIQTQSKVSRLMATVTVAVVSTGATVIAFKKRPTFGSATGEVTLGSVSIPAGTAVSKTVFKDISPVVMAPGQQLVFEVTTAATTSGSAVYGVEANLDPETDPNQSNMIESA